MEERPNSSNQSSSDKSSLPPPLILHGSGSGGNKEEENDPLPQPPPQHDHNLFIHEDEMVAWLHHPQFYSDILHSGMVSSSLTQPQSSLSLAPPPPTDTSDFPISQINTTRRPENFWNFARLRGNILPGAGPLIPVVRESTQVGSNATPSSSGTESCLTPAIHSTESRATVIRGVSPTFAVPGLGRKEKAVAVKTVYEIAGTSGSGVCKVETEPIQIQPATEKESYDDRKRKERAEPVDEIEETKEARRATSRKRSRAAEMHNLSERRRREKLNEKMKALQELIPRCNKSDKVSMLGDVIEYIKSLQMQVQMLLMGQGLMPMMYPPNMQQIMAMGIKGMDRPPFIPLPGTDFPRPAHMAGLGPSYPAPRYPFPNIQAFNPSRVHIPSQQPNPASNQPQFPGYMNPYSHVVGHQQMQQPPPPPLQNQTTSQLSLGQASSNKEPEDQENQPTSG